MKQTKLVIVESPAKCQKIEKFLSKKKEYTWIVKASYGHITELKESLEDSIDVKNNFKPTYIISSGKKKVVQELSQIIKKDNVEVIIATDPDREGEAIGYHLIKTLKLDIKNTKRIFFNQITEKAVLEAVDNPKTIDMNLVNAQQSRCILDKLVGFEISPILWKYIKYGLSAGRCQTPAIRLLTEKEKEINKFNKQSYYKITGEFIINDKNDNVNSEYNIIHGEIDKQFEKKEIITTLLNTFINDTFYIQDTKKTKSLRNPSAPFTTSTLQQDASSKLNISPKECMSIAQKLYENGYITYMRTDSIELSQEFKKDTNQYILQNYGNNYIYNVDTSKNRFKNKSKNSQEAHEAIRPVKVDKNTLPNSFNTREKNLYKLIWNRSVASLMTSQNLYIYKIFINTEKTKEIFISQYEETIFDGFSRLYQSSLKEDNDKQDIIKSIKKGQELLFKTIQAEQKYTKPIPRYTEASLIKELEKLGIGRPSTYSSIITKIQDKHYVEKKSKEGEEIISETLSIKPNKNKIIKKDNKIKHGMEKDKLYITPIGMMVNDFIEQYFIDTTNNNGIFDYQMTSEMENKLDDIADGKLKWIQVIKDIYNHFHPQVEQLKQNNTNNTEQKKLKYQKILGKDKDGLEIGITLGKNEYVVYKKSGDFKTKWKFANIQELNKNLEDITLKDALYLLRFPKELGKIDNKKVVLNKGPYGLYLTHNKKNYPVQNEEINLDNAKNIIEGNVDNTNENNNNIIGKYNEIPILFKKGKFGYYLSYNNKNYPIDKKIKSIDDIDLEKAIQFIKLKDNTFIKVIDKDISIRQNKKGNGYYIMYKKDTKSKPIFITIPKNDNINEYDKEKCMNLIQSQ